MKKKLALSAVTLLTLTTLAACGGSKNIATMKGSSITVEDFYDKAKTNSTNQELVRSMIIYDVFTNKYGKDVKQSEIDKKFDETKKQYGDSFKTTLQQNGLTEASYKERIKSDLALNAGLKAHIKLSKDDLKKAWEAFHPEVQASIIVLASEDEAKTVGEEAKKAGADFAKLAKEKSSDETTKADGGKIKFDSSSTTVPDEVKTAAFKLKDGQVSDVINVTNPSTYQTQYYIVKMEKNVDKGNDMTKYEKEVKKIAEDTKLADQTFTTKVIGDELKAANVKIEDDAFKTVLDQFTGTSSSSSSTKK
ncbi:foldase protein PrsA [Pilibacter termitis]|uniref:Foldase protein PrsA n=1 Tax=Pilibacter termitis TaxID=263852 RepID=A0A1T4L9N8_9ENTE|nr:peptidylprolyl isomerase [Pilibacter termitis]SJZ51416.1 foldase protein PrsA [Pilibacter termitis]